VDKLLAELYKYEFFTVIVNIEVMLVWSSKSPLFRVVMVAFKSLSDIRLVIVLVVLVVWLVSWVPVPKFTPQEVPATIKIASTKKIIVLK